MLTYMTSCGSSSCTTYNSSSSKWFKIQQVARVSFGGPWAQAAVMEGFPANVTLPSTLAPGNYLIRHEIMGLQGAVSVGGAEFYPACSQIKVGGSQTGGPTEDELVLLPGAYSDTDPGIYDPNVSEVFTSGFTLDFSATILRLIYTPFPTGLRPFGIIYISRTSNCSVRGRRCIRDLSIRRCL